MFHVCVAEAKFLYIEKDTVIEMNLPFDKTQMGVLLDHGVLHYVSDEEYRSGSEPDEVQVNEHVTIKVKVNTIGEVTRDKMLRRHYGTSGYTLDEFRALAHKYSPVIINYATLIEVVDTTPEQEKTPPKRRGRKPKNAESG